jgi:hypothetical protein
MLVWILARGGKPGTYPSSWITKKSKLRKEGNIPKY